MGLSPKQHLCHPFHTVTLTTCSSSVMVNNVDCCIDSGLSITSKCLTTAFLYISQLSCRSIAFMRIDGFLPRINLKPLILLAWDVVVIVTSICYILNNLSIFRRDNCYTTKKTFKLDIHVCDHFGVHKVIIYMHGCMFSIKLNCNRLCMKNSVVI